MTKDAPFCGGVLITRKKGEKNQILFTLNPQKNKTDDNSIIVEGVGGGQEIGEDAIHCARREAKEEIGSAVEIISSEKTIFGDIGGNLTVTDAVTDKIKPIIVQAASAPHLIKKPYKKGLPTGGILYGIMYLAKTKEIPRPLDVPAIIWVSAEDLEKLKTGVALMELLKGGGEIIKKDGVNINPDTILKTVFPRTENALINALCAHSDALRFIFF